MNWLTNIIGVPLGWIMWLLYSVIQNYGIVLILFTILVKALMFPLSVKQQKATAKMSVFQPKIQEIQKKYEKNKEKQQEEMMKLYETHGYNPMSGCLPMLLPFIILFGLIDVIYRPLTHILHIGSDVITNATEMLTGLGLANAGRPELGILSHIDKIIAINTQHVAANIFVNNSDLSAATGMIDWDIIGKIQNFDYSLFGIDLSVVPTWAWNWFLLIPILSGVTAFLVSMVSMKMNPAANQQAAGMGAMKIMMYIMPLFSVWIAFSVPVGVGFYWILSNVLSGVQSVILYKVYSPEKYKKEFEEKMQAEAEKKKLERAQRKKIKTENSDEPLDPETEKMLLSEKERNRRRLAEARKRDAEKYGEEYVEVTDKDLM